MPIFADPNSISWVVFLPALAAVGLLAQRIIANTLFDAAGLSGSVWRWVALGTSTLTFVLAVGGLWQGFDPEITDFQLVEHVSWMPSLGVNYFVGIDGISLVLVLLTSFVVPLAIVSSWNEVDEALESDAVFLLLFETGMNGALVSLNVIELYCFWELALISSFFIVGRWGGTSGLTAAVKYLMFGVASSFLFLIAILIVGRINFDQGGVFNFDLISPANADALGLLSTQIATEATLNTPLWQTQMWLFAAMALAFAIKIPLVPLHGWYNNAQNEAPTSGSILVSALVVKLGAVAFFRVALPLFPDAARVAGPWITNIALFGIVLSGLLALGQRDAKRLIGYVSLAHLSFIVLGIMSLNRHAMVGSVISMVSHGLSITALFVLLGFLIERRSTRLVSDFGGLAKPMPICAALFALVVLSHIGFPGSGGFVGSFLVFLGIYSAGAWSAILALAGMVLVAGTLLRAASRIMLGPLEHAENLGLIDFSLRERAVVLLLVLPLFWVGVYPSPVLRRVEPAVGLLLSAMDRRAAPNDREGRVRPNLTVMNAIPRSWTHSP
jgi:NADH-quinone oxidoreductase subunit M